MQGWSHADIALGASVGFVILACAVLALLLLAAFLPERYTPAHMRVTPWVSHREPDGTLAHELGPVGNFREPADPSYVDDLIRVVGRARVLHRPDPVQAEQVGNPYRVTLADLIEGSRYVVPALPYAPPALAAGRHRRELIAA
jgi:hypothetical protein